ncbi:MAG: hypothetical protein ABSH44_14255 [Bryobacteraceae bacterium]|jgi:hypothetical protein
MSHPDLAIVIGSPADHPIREEVERLAKGSGFEFVEKATHHEAADLLSAEPQLGSGRAFILLCSQCVVHDSLPNAVTVLRARRPDTGRVVVYAQDEWAGDVALNCIHAGAYDYLVPGYILSELSRHIIWAFQGGTPHAESPYTVYEGVSGLATDAKVFIAMPYNYDGFQHYHLGVSVALTHLGLKPVLASGTMRPTFLRTEVHRLIDQCKLVIANVSQYSREGVNANVIEEAQYAEDKGIPVLQIRCRDPRKGGRKTDIADRLGLLRLDYYACADLAVKLYFGIMPCLQTQ